MKTASLPAVRRSKVCFVAKRRRDEAPPFNDMEQSLMGMTAMIMGSCEAMESEARRRRV